MSAAAGFGDPPPHVAQRSRRDKLRFPPSADVMLPPPYDDSAFPPSTDAYVTHASAADLGYLHAVVAPPPPPAASDQWLAPQYDASASWARAKLEHDEARGFTTQQGATLSLTLSPAPQELPPAYGGSLQSVVGAAAAAAAAARPLGPFTGYAAVLKGSRFLRPAQQLLDEICAALVGAEGPRGSAGAGGSYSLASPSSLSNSTDTSDWQYQRPEFREKKANLLYMQEEVCKRYKQYHQQMQMVVSSFESVPGLSSATPYASSVLKAISRHFRRVRSIMSSQIQYISRVLGEELLTLPSSSSGGKAVARSLGLADQSQPVWRPQRGLPERAVSVLRAWLFDHFLHPYPTDADKAHAGYSDRSFSEPGVQLVHQRACSAVEAHGGGDPHAGDPRLGQHKRLGRPVESWRRRHRTAAAAASPTSRGCWRPPPPPPPPPPNAGTMRGRGTAADGHSGWRWWPGDDELRGCAVCGCGGHGRVWRGVTDAGTAARCLLSPPPPPAAAAAVWRAHSGRPRWLTARRHDPCHRSFNSADRFGSMQ